MTLSHRMQEFEFLVSCGESMERTLARLGWDAQHAAGTLSNYRHPLADEARRIARLQREDRKRR